MTVKKYNENEWFRICCDCDSNLTLSEDCNHCFDYRNHIHEQFDEMGYDKDLYSCHKCNEIWCSEEEPKCTC